MEDRKAQTSMTILNVLLAVVGILFMVGSGILIAITTKSLKGTFIDNPAILIVFYLLMILALMSYLFSVLIGLYGLLLLVFAIILLSQGRSLERFYRRRAIIIIAAVLLFVGSFAFLVSGLYGFNASAGQIDVTMVSLGIAGSIVLFALGFLFLINLRTIIKCQRIALLKEGQ